MPRTVSLSATSALSNGPIRTLGMPTARGALISQQQPIFQPPHLGRLMSCRSAPNTQHCSSYGVRHPKVSKMRAAKVCAIPGCPSIATEGSRCAAHPIQRTAPPWQHSKPAHERGYDAAHHTMRRRVLSEERTCRKCGDKATIADHISPLSRGGSSERSNYQGLCTSCSAAKTQQEAREGRRRARRTA